VNCGYHIAMAAIGATIRMQVSKAERDVNFWISIFPPPDAMEGARPC
jgi:hypothetical protein